MLEFRAGDQAKIIVTVKHRQTKEVIPLQLATEVVYTFLRPDGSSFTKTGSLHTDGADGKVSCVLTDELAAAHVGVWQYEVFVRVGAAPYTSDAGTFQLCARLGG
jgi:hypothetical protein